MTNDSRPPHPPGLPRVLGRAAVPCLLLGTLLLAACGGSEDTYEIQDVRRLEARGGAAAPTPPPEPRWSYDLPAGWEVLPPTRFTLLGFRVPEQPGIEASFSMAGGGLLPNLNRWRTQMELDPIAEAEVDGLPRRPFLGGEGLYVDLRGRYRGMGAEAKFEDARMLGLILDGGDQMAFLKMVGPADAVEAQKAHFDALAASLAPAPTDAPPLPAEGDMPAGHPPVPGMPGSTAGGPPSPSSLSWKAPEGWLPQPDRPFREVTFVPQSAPNTECWVSLAGGDLLGNVNRWQMQMGQPAVTSDALAAFPRIEVNGQQALVVEIRGTYRGMRGGTIEDAVMLALVAERPGESVFVKMVGPADEVKAEREKFEAFCRSLAW